MTLPFPGLMLNVSLPRLSATRACRGPRSSISLAGTLLEPDDLFVRPRAKPHAARARRGEGRGCAGLSILPLRADDLGQDLVEGGRLSGDGGRRRGRRLPESAAQPGSARGRVAVRGD